MVACDESASGVRVKPPRLGGREVMAAHCEVKTMGSDKERPPYEGAGVVACVIGLIALFITICFFLRGCIETVQLWTE